jgi:FAD synthetase
VVECVDRVDVVERLRAYILNVEQFVEKVLSQNLSEDARRLVELAKSYLSDAKYYYESGDHFTSLACIAYAEGVLDALRLLGIVKGVDWKPLTELVRRPTVLVAGAFEFLHPGHLYLLRKAWEIGRVHVVVARDVNFERFKGRKPALSELDRLKVVESVKYVSSASLGDEKDFFKPILEVKPDIVLLGPDQWIDPEELKKILEERGLRGVKVFKLEARVGDWSSTSIYNGLKARICGQDQR